MTEAEWLTSEVPTQMLEFIAKEKPGPRKLRLFACACCRAASDETWPQHSRDVVAVAESFADGYGTERELNDARSRAYQTAQNFIVATRRIGPSLVMFVHRLLFAGDTALPDLLIAQRMRSYYSAGTFRTDKVWKDVTSAILQEVFGNPFRPVTFSPVWRTSTAVALAAQMYDARDFGAMPILADALQDAGCDSADVLNHCRGPGPHVRGCWVVDLVLGKE